MNKWHEEIKLGCSAIFSLSPISYFRALCLQGVGRYLWDNCMYHVSAEWIGCWFRTETSLLPSGWWCWQEENPPKHDVNAELKWSKKKKVYQNARSSLLFSSPCVALFPHPFCSPHFPSSELTSSCLDMSLEHNCHSFFFSLSLSHKQQSFCSSPVSKASVFQKRMGGAGAKHSPTTAVPWLQSLVMTPTGRAPKGSTRSSKYHPPGEMCFPKLKTIKTWGKQCF